MKGCTSSLSGYSGYSGEGKSGVWEGVGGGGSRPPPGARETQFGNGPGLARECWGGQITFPIASGLWNFLWGVGAEAGEDEVGLRLAGDE